MDLARISPYIENIYAHVQETTRADFIKNTRFQDFIPVVDEDVARLLKVIILLARPARILEIGTSIGYSAMSMALMARTYGGKITTIEFDKNVSRQAKENFIKAGVDEIIDLHVGDARNIIPDLTPGFDLIFQDVDKKLYPLLFNDCLRLLKPGGILVAEDTLFPVIDLDERWADLVEPIQQFNTLVVECSSLQSTILPIGDGVTLAVKLSSLPK